LGSKVNKREFFLPDIYKNFTDREVHPFLSLFLPPESPKGDFKRESVY
jgi:hypothetical protein